MAQRSSFSFFTRAFNFRLALAVLSVASIRAATIADCDNLKEEFIVNANSQCQYTTIFCNGDDSYYCTDIECRTDFQCTTTAETTTAFTQPTSTSTATTTTTTTTTTNATPASTSRTTVVTPSRPSEGITVRTKCQRSVYGLFPFPNNCNYYYRCFNGYLYVEQCPFGHVYNDDQKYCSSRHTSLLNCKTL